MDNIQEAREALARVVACVPRNIARYQDFMGLADDYALAVHIKTCQARDCTPGYGAPSYACGSDGWYCDVAKVIQNGR